MIRRLSVPAAVLVCLLLASPASAVIMRLVALKEVLAAEETIFVATVEKLDPERPAAVFTLGQALKGQPVFARMAVNLTGDAEAARDGHTPKLIKRLAPGSELVVFASKRGKAYGAFVFTNGTWFQMRGVPDGDAVRWAFTHAEPYLRRTFKGTTAELVRVVKDGLAGKAAPPEPDPKVEPGFGPESKPEAGKERGERPLSPSRPLFAVIPTFVLIGPLAILAALFPAVFGGLALLLKRWMVMLSVASLLSTLYLLYAWFRPALTGTVGEQPATLWYGFAVLAGLGTVWSTRRVRRAAGTAEADTFRPRSADRVMLWTLAALGLAGLALARWAGKPLADSPWQEMLVACTTVWVGVLYLGLVRPSKLEALPLEAVMLGGLTLACTNVGTLEAARTGSGAVVVSLPGSGEGETRTSLTVAVDGEFTAEGNGVFYASPGVTSDRVFAAAALAAGFQQEGAIYCLDHEGKEQWRFTETPGDDGRPLKPVFCSPVVVDGRVYVGEGLHTDQDCCMYCLDAATGKLLWQFATTSHTESTPAVVGGRVYFGAGDDGLYCLDAATGKKLWQLPGLHVDANPAVIGNRVYVGSGVGDKFNITKVFCVAADTGKMIWEVPTPQAAFGSPIVAGGRVYFGIGNGNVEQSAPQPSGSLWCLDAADGRRLWTCDVGDAVLGTAAVDYRHVYFGSRDGHVYAADRADGRVRWKAPLGGPVVAAVSAPWDGEPGSPVRAVYAASGPGKLAALDPVTGRELWAVDLGKHAGMPAVKLYSSPTVELRSDGGRRVWFGTGLTGSLGLGSLARLYRVSERPAE